MLLINFDFYDIHSVLTVFRAKPEKEYFPWVYVDNIHTYGRKNFKKAVKLQFSHYNKTYSIDLLNKLSK